MDGSNAACVNLSNAEVEHVVTALRALDHRSAWERTIEIGRVVFESIVRGDEREWRSRRSQKNVSLRKLVEHPGCPFKRSALSSAVNIHLFVLTTPAVQRLPGITPTHVAQTLNLPPARALSVLTKASDEGWSVRELGLHVRSKRKEEGERRGRPLSPAGRKAETMARRSVVALRRVCDHLSATGGVSKDSAQRLNATLDEIGALLADARRLTSPPLRSEPFLALTKASERIEPAEAATA